MFGDVGDAANGDWGWDVACFFLMGTRMMNDTKKGGITGVY